nr:MAG TPA: hypothetical protein [Caudoviricetes sp.]
MYIRDSSEIKLNIRDNMILPWNIYVRNYI